MPRDGTRVIEMDGNEPSKTLGTQILADLGADVLLIERPEPVRPRDPNAPPGAFTMTDAMRWGMHRGKRAITLDLREERDRSAYHELVAGAHAVYDNYRPGVKARLGVSRDDLVRIKPGIVSGTGDVAPMMPRGVVGMNANMMAEYLQFIANRRLAQIGLAEQFPGVKNPFPWMSEIMDLKKEKNFFETRVTEYQTGGALTWD
jgi:crotonobetainyl-CoA:carnitine CoA-transferase CaiB-like acyl-CoA transferase